MAESRPGGIGFLNALPHDGERRLMLAVLMDAIRIITRRRPRAPHLRGSRVWERERIWFETEDPSNPFSFTSICDALGLDTAYIRGRVLPASQNWGNIREAVTIPRTRNQWREVSAI